MFSSTHTQKAQYLPSKAQLSHRGKKLKSYFLHTIITAISSTQVKPKQTKEWKLQGSGRNRTNHLQESSRASSTTLGHKPLHFFSYDMRDTSKSLWATPLPDVNDARQGQWGRNTYKTIDPQVQSQWLGSRSKHFPGWLVVDLTWLPWGLVLQTAPELISASWVLSNTRQRHAPLIGLRQCVLWDARTSHRLPSRAQAWLHPMLLLRLFSGSKMLKPIPSAWHTDRCVIPTALV